MKALQTKAPGQYGLVNLPIPEIGEDECLIKIGAASICHTDVIIKHGKASHVRYPVVPGHEFGGVIAKAGSKVTHLKEGDKVAVHALSSCGFCRFCHFGNIVYCPEFKEFGSSLNGGFEEYAAIPGRLLFPIGKNMTLQEAALVEPAANAYSAVRQSDIKPGDKVLIIGPGAIGLLALQFAKLYSPDILVLAGTRDERLSFGAKLGAVTVNVTKPGVTEKILNLMAGTGADVIIECAGNKNAVELALKVAGMNSRIVIEGSSGVGEKVEVAPFDDLVRKGMILRGINGWKTSDFVNALEYIKSGLIDVKSLITHTFLLEQWEEAFQFVESRKNEAMKVQFVPD